ncbi:MULTISPECIES: ABC transporter substrate-binding protein [Streptomyces]|uniref:ABC transporter substrate-binding protein n=1 Tax=Streptomyces koelreuteriae TaxID=2838015 RepID=A0ABX8FJK1_9ACTN|nr:MULTISPECIES: ABC transporter substrate-binding protein [Streptomyces]QWB21267.1 ABC transporter substrate-binding protein [Streptomyces koelreuteriae]UUA04184.1 ABC transporter substrate-binding protein [Streptomyces koelreuteriae]UUA11810.1 ABC transporter substrate-binding protein [Streptomyces sp. CRCS-T-1]
MIRTTTRRALGAALSLTALLATTACGGSGAAASGGSDSGTLVIGDQAKNLQTLFNASGALKGTSYKVKWAEFEGAAPLFQAVQAGAADTSYAADLPTLQALSGGVPVKAVGALRNDGTHTGIVVRGNSSVKSVKDLKGKKVVVSSAKGSIAEYLLAHVLQRAGLKYSDVKVQYLLPTDAQAAFTSGKIEAWATFGVYKAVAEQQGGRLLVNGADGRVSGYGFIGASEKALADKTKKAAIADYLRRLDKALAWSRKHPDDYAKAIQRNNGASPAIAKTLVSQSNGELLPVGSQVVESVQKVGDTMHGIGVLTPNPTVADHVDSSLVKE